MPVKFKPIKEPKPPKADKVILKPPRIKPAQMRNYGKGLSTETGGATSYNFGTNIGYGG